MTKAEAIAVEEYRRAHVPLYNDQKLKLGVFGINCSYGLNISHAPTTYKVTWEHTSEIVKRADAMGFELALPVARECRSPGAECRSSAGACGCCGYGCAGPGAGWRFWPLTKPGR